MSERIVTLWAYHVREGLDSADFKKIPKGYKTLDAYSPAAFGFTQRVSDNDIGKYVFLSRKEAIEHAIQRSEAFIAQRETEIARHQTILAEARALLEGE